MSFGLKLLAALVCALTMVGCGTKADGGAAAAKSAESSTPATRTPTQQSGDEAPPAEKTGGVDGKRAFAQVAKQGGFGPRPSGSEAIGRLQEYIQGELTSYGCKVDADSFAADTPVGRLPVKNIVVKVAGGKPGNIMVAQHYNNKLQPRLFWAECAECVTGV